MTKRVKLLLAIQNFLQREATLNADRLDSVRMGKYVNAIQRIDTRIPKLVMPAPRIKSQKNLF